VKFIGVKNCGWN